MTEKKWRLLNIGEVVPQNAQVYDPDKQAWERSNQHSFTMAEGHWPRRVLIEPEEAKAKAPSTPPTSAPSVQLVVTLDDETKTLLADLRRDLIVALDNLTTEVKHLKDRSSGYFRG
jgi:hypothetical protein